jgi:hypothetical protein
MGIHLKIRNYIYSVATLNPDPLLESIAKIPVHYLANASTLTINGTKYASAHTVRLLIILHKLGLRRGI